MKFRIASEEAKTLLFSPAQDTEDLISVMR